jgi:hypothetical protein
MRRKGDGDLEIIYIKVVCYKISGNVPTEIKKPIIPFTF